MQICVFTVYVTDSGHGGLTKDLDGDEESGYDEVIYPVDFQANGQIVDDVSVPPPARVIARLTIACRRYTTLW